MGMTITKNDQGLGLAHTHAVETDTRIDDPFAPAPAKSGLAYDSGYMHDLSNIRVGTSVEVRSRFEQTWLDGYTVESISDGGLELKRESDGFVLPSLFGPDEVRKARRRSTWWS